MPSMPGPGQSDYWPRRASPWQRYSLRVSLLVGIIALVLAVFRLGAEYADVKLRIEDHEERLERLEDFYYPRAPMDGP